MLLDAGCTRPPPAKPPPDQAALNGEARQVAAATDVIWVQGQASGMVVAVVHGDQATALAYGLMGPNDARPADARTLVRLQSVSKLFAGELLGDLASQGKVKLADPLTLYAPRGWQAPKSKNAPPPITLVSLATHTSGLPREAAIEPGQSAAQASAARWAWLARQRRLPPPGVGALYSNIAFDLLGDALASASKAPYGAALNAEVTAPLGMSDTTATPSAEQCGRMMAGDPNRKPFPCVDQSGEAASGGLYSTASDMALWLKAQLAPSATPGARAISQAVYVRREQLKTTSGLDHAGSASGIGLAWIEQDASPGRPRILEKTGGGDGFLTYVAIDPVHRAGVFVGFNNVSGHRLGAVAEAADQLVFLLGAEPDAVALPGTSAVPAH
ncbi:MAG: D-alanyl-D-alanine-carboxypeptidase/endopeptidase AmpH [Caulobacteraceae bacterium]